MELIQGYEPIGDMHAFDRLCVQTSMSLACLVQTIMYGISQGMCIFDKNEAHA